MRRFLISLMLMIPVSALAEGNMLVLKQTVTDGDGRITLGDLFDYAGQASDVVLGQRQGQSAVLDAGRVQVIAQQNGFIWNNPTGIRRIIVTQGADSAPPALVRASTKAVSGKTQDALVFTRALNSGEVVQPSDISFAPVQAHLLRGPSLNPQDVIGKSAKWPVREGAAVRASDLGHPVVIKKSDSVKVVWSVGGVTLSMTGKAQKDGAAGDVIQVINPTSKKTVDAVVTGPGSAAAGPDATRLRTANPQYYSAR